MQLGNKELKLSLFTDDMIVYIENPKGPAKKISTDELRNVIKYKINIWKSIIHLYTNNEQN